MKPAPRILTIPHLLAALLVGTLDICAACIQYYVVTGKGPGNVLRYIASGMFGKQAYTGSSMLWWGLAFHFIAAIGFAFLFFMLVSRLPKLLSYKLWLAILYAAFMWAAMRFIVIPLSNITPPALKLKGILIAITILIICISTPLILVATREQSNHANP